MCQTCGCTPCMTCGRDIEESACVGCGMASSQCTCDPAEQEAEAEEELD